jgi:hypothetical protein
MAFVYLISNIDDDNICKIGVTKKKDIENRKKELQTGSSNELYIRNSFETKYPYKLEKMLHRHFHDKILLNEWFKLSNEDINNFINTCNKYENILLSLKDNPFF